MTTKLVSFSLHFLMIPMLLGNCPVRVGVQQRNSANSGVTSRSHSQTRGIKSTFASYKHLEVLMLSFVNHNYLLMLSAGHEKFPLFNKKALRLALQ